MLRLPRNLGRRPIPPLLLPPGEGGPKGRMREETARFQGANRGHASWPGGLSLLLCGLLGASTCLGAKPPARAGGAMKAVLKGNVQPAVRNEAAYRLARIHFQKDQPRDALTALERIHGKVPEAIRDDVSFLRGNVYLAVGRFGDAARIFRDLQGGKGCEGCG